VSGFRAPAAHWTIRTSANNVLAALDTADSPSVLLSVVHSMPARAEVSTVQRPDADNSWLANGKRDHAVPMTPAIAAWFSRPKNPRHPDSPSTDFTPFLIAASTISCRDPGTATPASVMRIGFRVTK
jgi:hypothetical protein